MTQLLSHCNIVTLAYLVIVRDVLSGKAIVGHLVQLRRRRGGGVQVEEMVNSRVKRCQVLIFKSYLHNDLTY